MGLKQISFVALAALSLVVTTTLGQFSDYRAGFSLQNPCVSKQTCSECLQTPTCAWCKKEVGKVFKKDQI